MAKVLYISYDGMLEPLGRSQVLGYLEKLAETHKIVLISYEKSSDLKQKERRKELKSRINNASIVWIPMRYHKKPSSVATAYDVFRGIIVASFAALKYKISIVHARSYVPSLIALFLKWAFNKKFIFDMRGFWADERVDGGLWPANSRIYKVAKWFEKKFLIKTDCVVSLTKAAIEHMQTFEYLAGRQTRFEHITTCADLDLFRPPETITGKPGNRFTLGYVGSVGVWYLFDEVLRFYRMFHEKIPHTTLHIINRGDHPYIYDRLVALNIDLKFVKVESLEHKYVAKAMHKMDAGIFFIKPAYSKLASSPTKLGEFLGCGVPCIGNKGVGDMAEILEDNNVGVALNGFETDQINRSIDEFLRLKEDNEISKRCREVALKYFPLDHGVKKYNEIYNSLGK